MCLRPRPLRGGPVGRIADLTTGTPWAEDTLQYVFSTSAHGYHAHTFGWLVGEVIRRITGRTPGTFFADEIATPLNPDAYIGLPPGHQHRVSRLIEPPAALHRDSTALRRASARHQAPHRPQRPPGPRRRNPLLQRHHHRPRHRPLLQHAHRPDRGLPTTRSRHRLRPALHHIPRPALSATAAAAAHSAAPTRPDINKIWVIEEVETFSQLCLGEQPASGHV